jgi:formylglycine-generating enzyme required for sulfatase activity/cephalosporin-C deacetylase-like acetyl esterase
MGEGKILESWKEIAAHLNRNIRTCQMWEREMGLPIHRLDGSPKARVFAYRDELDRWLDEKLHEREREEAGRERAKKAKGGKRPLGLPTLPRWNIGLIAGLAVALTAAVAVSAWLIHLQSRIRWANDVAIPEIEGLLMTSENKKVFDLAMRLERIIPKSPKLSQLILHVAWSLSVETNPSGASVFVKEYGAPEESWKDIGPSPISGRRLPQGYWHIKIQKPGLETYEEVMYVYTSQAPRLSVALDRAGQVPSGMIHIRGSEFYPLFLHQSHLKKRRLADYYLDRYEVTNREFKRFVDAGGYERPEFWKGPITFKGIAVPWAQAVSRFVDKTGRPGPATWELGDHSPGRGDDPVSGVSWYEAAAYAEFVAKRLPTVLHWGRAAGNYHTDTGFILPKSNFKNRGPAPVGSFKGLGPFGTYDMAGNVKEWCSNDVKGNKYCLGGGWKDDEYMFNHLDAYDPARRDEDIGFRCMKAVPGKEDAAEIYGPLEDYPTPDFTKFRPCSDEVFDVYRRLYAYPKTPLQAKIESHETWSESSILEKVTFSDSFGEERVPAYIFLPRRGVGPFQTIVYFPGASATSLSSVFDDRVVQTHEVDIFTNSGRAFVIPILKGTYERREKEQPIESRERLRDLFIRRCRDFMRCVDYLEARSDIDHERLAYQGLSWGANVGPLILALDGRLRVGIFLSGGMDLDDYRPERYSPETDVLNFAPRAKTPVLILNGRYDFLSPIKEECSVLLKLMGTPDKDKALRVYDTGHHVWQLNQTRRDVFDFLDKYLGPVQRGSAGGGK